MSQQLVFGCLFGALACARGATGAASYQNHIRVTNGRILEVLQFAFARSAAFRGIVARINASDRIVYVDDGVCRHGEFHSCLQVAPGVPFLFVRVAARESRPLVVRQLAHELQHAAEIAERGGDGTAASVELLYAGIGYPSCEHGCYETPAAQEIEAQVSRETTRSATPQWNARHFGVWRLDLRRSSIQGCAPSFAQRIDRDRGHGLVSSVIDVVDCDGRERRDAFVFKVDGREYPIEPDPARTITLTPVDERTVAFAIKERGTVTCGRRRVSADGEVLTIETWSGGEESGAPETIEVWTRVP
jgi:hypothetical protein